MINNDWIDALQLRKFLARGNDPQPRSSSPPPESSLTPIKLEKDASDASATRLLTSANVSGFRTQLLREGNREVLEILSDSDSDSEESPMCDDGRSDDTGEETTGM